MAFSFLTQELAMDLGTANTVIYQNDQKVLDEPSIVAIDNSTGKAIALGKKAKQSYAKRISLLFTLNGTYSVSVCRP